MATEGCIELEGTAIEGGGGDRPAEPGSAPNEGEVAGGQGEAPYLALLDERAQTRQGAAQYVAGLCERVCSSSSGGQASPSSPSSGTVWDEVDRRIPWRDDAASQTARDDLFRKLDPNRNRLLSLTEVQSGLPHLLEARIEGDRKRKTGAASESLIPGVKDLRPSIKLAFKAAQGRGTSAASLQGRRGGGSTSIDRQEFQVFLAYFRHYVELLALMKMIDSSEDMRVSRDECMAAMPLLADWNVSAAQVLERFPKDSSVMRFEDFANWCLGQKLGDHAFGELAGGVHAAEEVQMLSPTNAGEAIDYAATAEAEFTVSGAITQALDNVSPLAVAPALLPEAAFSVSAEKLGSPEGSGKPGELKVAVPASPPALPPQQPEGSGKPGESKAAVPASPPALSPQQPECSGKPGQSKAAVPASPPAVPPPRPRRSSKGTGSKLQGSLSASSLEGASGRLRGSLSASSQGGAQEGAPFLKSLSTFKSLPQISMARRGPSTFINPNSNPAPGSYNSTQDERHSKYNVQPQYSFGGSSRFDLGESPGRLKPAPGAYEPRDDRFRHPRAPQVGFGMGGSAARGRPNPIRQLAPGPGAYDLKTTVNDGPMVTAQGKRSRTRIRQSSMPGPGQYDPTEEYVSVGAPKVGFGTSAREDFIAKHQTCAPGPGSYKMQNRQGLGTGSAKFSVTSRHRAHDLSSYMAPGPGSYDSHATSFGYT